MSTLGQDVRYGLRSLRNNPGTTLVILFTLALGIGANTAIFTLVNAALLKQLPYRDPDRLVFVKERFGTQPEGNPVSPGNFLDWQRDSRSFEKIAAFFAASLILAEPNGAGVPERTQGNLATGDFFAVLGIPPAQGRVLTNSDDRHGANRVVVISDDLWRTRFGARPDAVGSKLRVNGNQHEVIGIMPPAFVSTERQVQLWIPLRPEITPAEMAYHGNHGLAVIARLRPGITHASAAADVSAIEMAVHKAFPRDPTGDSALIVSMRDELVGSSRQSLLILLGAVGCMLLIATVNVANVLLARATDRRREIAIRTALGAARGRVVRQLLTESVLLGLLGGAAGLLVAVWATRLLVAIVPEGTTGNAPIEIDGMVLGFILLVSLAAGLLFGLAPALAASRTGLAADIKESGRGATGGTAQKRSRDLLVTAELALSLVLLASAGLLLKSSWRLSQVDPGIRPSRLLTMQLSLSASGYRDDRGITVFYQRLLESVRHLPRVQAASLVSVLPVTGQQNDNVIEIPGRPVVPGQYESALTRVIDPEYFQTMGIRMVRGRAFTWQDRAGTGEKIVVSESFAKRFFPRENPLGKGVKVTFYSQVPREIVGVVGDVRTELHQPMEPTMYMPFLQLPRSHTALVVRTVAEPAGLVAAIRTELRKIDSGLPLYGVRTMEEVIQESIAPRRFQFRLLSIFAACALLLAGIGIYGVVSFTISRRTAEIGLRMALGAKPRDVFALVIGQGLRPTIGGLALGLMAAVAAGRLLSGLLYEVSPVDGWVLASVALLLGLVSVLASYVPAWRAMRIDPVAALRSE